MQDAARPPVLSRSSGPDTRAGLRHLIRQDQLAGIQRNLMVAVPVNIALSLATLAVSYASGYGNLAAYWFTASLAVSSARLVSAMRGVAREAGDGADANRTIDLQLALSWILAGFSGLAWALIPFMSGYYTAPGSMFHLIVGAGITGGAVALGVPYAGIVIGFVTPILLSTAYAMFVVGGIERTALAATILLYLAALIRSAIQNEQAFVDACRLKHEARHLADSLREAHARSLDVAALMAHRATHDSLTGLLNRAGFMQEVDAHSRTATTPYAYLLLDLDGFKSINDAFGHQAGDRVLVEVAQRLKQVVGPDVPVARLGGDEFAIYLPDRPDAEAIAALAERLIESISPAFGPVDAGRVGLSIGIHHGVAPASADMLVYADEALHAAKNSGRNRFCLFDEALRTRLEMRRDSERDIPAAMAQRQLELWYQPIYGEGGTKLSHIEALIRWNHPRHGWISPADIIPAAAMAGKSERLLAYILTEACNGLKILTESGFGEVAVAINVSPREMSKIPVDRIVLDKLTAAGVPPSRLEIEITEETALDIRSVEAKLANLARVGIKIGVDDFGVGYSSLASLRLLQANRVKIDRSFITGISQAPESRMLVEAVLSLGQAMKLDVVAEGVETLDDLQTLRACGCRYMQGYYLARPMPLSRLIEHLSAQGKSDGERVRDLRAIRGKRP